MNTSLLSEGTGGTDNQQLAVLSRSSPSQSAREINQRNEPLYLKRNDSVVLTLEGYLVQAAQNNDIPEVQQFLSRSLDLDITAIVDPRRYSLLHFAAFNNQYPGVMLLITHVQNQLRRLQKSEEEIYKAVKSWINKQTDDGFTALHFASYRGNIRMIEQLQKQGADISLKNKHGMNVLHISAQGDQPISLAYFKYEGIPFQQFDAKGGTALHWSTFYGCEQATNYIVAWNQININQPDFEGLTPLHLGCMSGNSRVVKRLLVKGANKFLTDNKGMTPADIAKENNFTNIEKMLNDKTSFFVDYYNVRPGFKKVERSRTQLFKFVFMYLFSTGICILDLFVLTSHRKNEMIYFSVVQVIIFGLLIAVCNRDPGFLRDKSLPKSNKLSQVETKPLVNLLKQVECFEICPECEIIKPPRSKHCDICGRCVGVYDHHCPWINNCVGKDNHGLFYFFIILFFLDLLFYLGLFIFFLVKDFENVKYDSYLDPKYYFKWVTAIVLGLCITMCAIFSIPMLLLISVQTKNLLIGRTTYERYSSSSQSRLENKLRSSSNIQGSNISMNKDSMLSRVGQEGSYVNCFDMCINNSKNPEYAVEHKPLESAQQYDLTI